LVSNLGNLQLTDITIEASSLEGMVYQENAIDNLENSDNFRNNNLAVGGNGHSLPKDKPISVSDTETNNNNDSIVHEISDVQDHQEDEDNDIGWITPDNIDKYQAKEQKISVNLKKDNLENMKIACMTTDYSMQVCKIICLYTMDNLLMSYFINYLYFMIFTRMFCYKCD